MDLVIGLGDYGDGSIAPWELDLYPAYDVMVPLGLSASLDENVNDALIVAEVGQVIGSRKCQTAALL